MSDTLTLMLKDGTKITGTSFGASVASAGEVVFMTGMTGYPEALTDPSFAGQILVLTYPLIGNYGVPGKGHETRGEGDGDAPPGRLYVEQNFESDKLQIAGLIVSEYCAEHSHANAIESLGEWLAREGVPGMTGGDTRALTQHLRESGAILGKLEFKNKKTDWYDPNAEHIVAQVSPREPTFHKRGKKTIAILDCGMKLGILRNFLDRDVSVWHLPFDHDLSGIDYDGLFISNGPGDPARAVETIATVKKALKGDKPIFGICLGHQILALAAGIGTYKLPYGHRSQNQPVREVATGRCFVTSQNHGFAANDRMPAGWEVAFENINDGSVEGLRHKTKPFSSVQFHPEACPGPVDANYLFDAFIRQL